MFNFELLERKFLFSMSRAVFLALSALSMLAIVILFLVFAFEYKDSRVDSRVSPEMVSSLLDGPSKASSSRGGGDEDDGRSIELDDLKIPNQLAEVMTGRNREILDGWLIGIDSGDRQTFINELTSVVEYSSKKGVTRANTESITIKSINAYKEVKMKKLKKRYAAKSKFNSQAFIFASLMGGLLALIVLIAMCLALFSIERNTRRINP